MKTINTSMAFDPFRAALANDFLQQDLDFFSALRQAGVAEEDFDDYAVGPDGNILSATADRINNRSPEPLPEDISPFGEENEPEELAQQDGNLVRAPAAPLGLTYQFNDVDGYDIFDSNGQLVTTVNDESQAILYIQNAELDSVGFAAQEDAKLNQDTLARAADQADGNATKAALKNAQDQATIQQRYNQTTQGDWRVRIRLMPGANYLYRADATGILSPLRATDGVIFPYVPTIQTVYQANYDKYDLTHSNYRGYFYKNSAVGEITVNGVFTAQDTREAEYLLAVIHFFRSVTKMFYGQDELRGAPPPLVELSGFGQFQFNNHPCAVSSFNYNLPNGVDYIRVNPNNQGLSLAPRDPLTNSSPNTIASVINRLRNANLQRGAQDLGAINQPSQQTVNGTGQTTYVPTKMEIQLVILPIQTRSQISQQFSLRDFANGNLLRGGFW